MKLVGGVFLCALALIIVFAFALVTDKPSRYAKHSLQVVRSQDIHNKNPTEAK